MTKRQINGILFKVILVVILVILLFPFYSMIIMSTHKSIDLILNIKFTPGDYFRENLDTVLATKIWVNIKNSMIISTTSAIVGTLFSAMAGFAFAKYTFKFKNSLYFCVLASLILPRQISLIGYVLEMRYLGLANTYLSQMLPVFANSFGVYWMAEYLKDAISVDLLAAARVDGCKESKIFFWIVVPIIKPALLTVFLLIFLNSWNDYLLPLALLTKEAIYPITLAIAAFRGEYDVDYAAKCLATAIAIAPIIIGYSLMSKQFISGLTAGSVKG